MGWCWCTVFNTTLYSINSIKTTNSSVCKFFSDATQGRGWGIPKSGMVVPKLKQPYTYVANINSIKKNNSSVSNLEWLCQRLNNYTPMLPTLTTLKQPILVYPNMEWSCQRCASIVVALYGMLSRGGGGGCPISIPHYT